MVRAGSYVSDFKSHFEPCLALTGKADVRSAFAGCISLHAAPHSCHLVCLFRRCT